MQSPFLSLEPFRLLVHCASTGVAEEGSLADFYRQVINSSKNPSKAIGCTDSYDLRVRADCTTAGPAPVCLTHISPTY